MNVILPSSAKSASSLSSSAAAATKYKNRLIELDLQKNQQT